MHLKELLHPLNNVLHGAVAMTFNCATDLLDRTAAHPLGQFLLRKTEDVVWAFEKSIKWAMPSEVKRSTEATGAGVNGLQEKEEPSRPLPWIFFIPVLLLWRCTRFAYETASSMMGSTPLQPTDMVDFLQNQRRNLRAVRIRGKRDMTSHNASPTGFSKLKSLVQHVLSRAVCFPGPESQQDTKTCVAVTLNSQVAEEAKGTETVMEKLDRLSRQEDNIEDDPDFEPAETSASSVAALSSDGDDATEDEREDNSTTPTPDATATLRSSCASSLIGDVIEEEDESSDVEGAPHDDNVNSDSYVTTSSFALEDSSGDGKMSDGGSKMADHDSSSLSAISSDIISDISESHDSALQKISNIFKKKPLLSQTSL